VTLRSMLETHRAARPAAEPFVREIEELAASYRMDAIRSRLADALRRAGETA
jgi:hypothetical protein